MKPRRILLCLAALVLTAGAMVAAWRFSPAPTVLEQALPHRQLLRIWALSSPGGGEAWLKKQLRAFEKQHPGVMTYLRTVSARELTNPEAVLPDLVLYMPGDLEDPERFFSPIAGEQPLREPLLRCGRYRGQQYALPLCWGGYVLCISAAAEPSAAVTPAPTTLLGRPAATPEASASPLPYPYEAAMQVDTPLLAPQGCGVFTLCCLLESGTRPPLGDTPLTPPQVYASYRSGQCATAVLTTGQLAAFSDLTAAGKGFPFRAMAPEEVVTDQVWLGSVVRGAESSPAPLLLSFLTGESAQRALASQSLYPARASLKLYGAGTAAEVESAGARSLSALNAYASQADAFAAARQVYQGASGLSEALLPLL